jgi:hypothetical protein
VQTYACEKKKFSTCLLNFNLIYLYMAERGLSWKQCICTDGGRLKIGETHGFIAHIKTIAPECISSNCIIHRQALALKKECKCAENGVTRGCEDCKSKLSYIVYRKRTILIKLNKYHSFTERTILNNSLLQRLFETIIARSSRVVILTCATDMRNFVQCC